MSRETHQAPRGTRDFYPEDLRARSWLFEHFRATAALFGFEEVDAPVVENAELFTRKAGEEIVDQLYHFVLHDRHLALRPEITPQIARMVMARHGSLRLPLRWFSIPQCWRYERMSRGRRREHYQWNMDIWGEPGVAAEAEL
ncbi:MAG TPA: ATP phosphoribosyltransferase regulatory subunit, partial [Myxococcota bacterium]|nr:ATP phosphoribosyltransferase regulatory subunit [Myxococcota bacterium]